MKALITGIRGFVGKHLADLLESEGFEVIGIDRAPYEEGERNYHQIDVVDADNMEIMIGKFKPDQIYHLAAPAFIPDSYNNPLQTVDAILRGTMNILECIRKVSPDTKLLYVGSSDEYGNWLGEPFKEETPLDPRTPYAAAKAAASMISRQYALFYGIKVVRTRSFNHIGPGQSPRFVCSGMAKQIAALEQSGGSNLIMGNLDSRRDFIDVRDAVRAYYMIMATEGNSGEVYNVCSGKTLTIAALLEQFLERTDLRARPGFAVVSEDQNRLHDNAVVCGDNSKLRGIGWSARQDFKQTVEDTLNYWRSQL
jgi:GDP-4-dehydro-6-deoxy-D-mannose reductase